MLQPPTTFTALTTNLLFTGLQQNCILLLQQHNYIYCLNRKTTFYLFNNKITFYCYCNIITFILFYQQKNCSLFRILNQQYFLVSSICFSPSQNQQKIIISEALDMNTCIIKRSLLQPQGVFTICCKFIWVPLVFKKCIVLIIQPEFPNNENIVLALSFYTFIYLFIFDK